MYHLASEKRGGELEGVACHVTEDLPECMVKNRHIHIVLWNEKKAL